MTSPQVGCAMRQWSTRKDAQKTTFLKWDCSGYRLYCTGGWCGKGGAEGCFTDEVSETRKRHHDLRYYSMFFCDARYRYGTCVVCKWHVTWLLHALQLVVANCCAWIRMECSGQYILSTNCEGRCVVCCVACEIKNIQSSLPTRRTRTCRATVACAERTNYGHVGFVRRHKVCKPR